jgi:hypothetical protein
MVLQVLQLRLLQRIPLGRLVLEDPVVLLFLVVLEFQKIQMILLVLEILARH